MSMLICAWFFFLLFAHSFRCDETILKLQLVIVFVKKKLPLRNKDLNKGPRIKFMPIPGKILILKIISFERCSD